MTLERPDLSQIPQSVVDYILALEEAIERLQGGRRSAATAEPEEPPTTQQIISATVRGVAKRTPRHLYVRQRRGGMGVFDLEAPDDDPPALLAVADAGDLLLIATNLGRVFRMPVAELPETEGRARGSSLAERLKLLPNEWLVGLLPADAGEYLVLVSQRGRVQRVRASYVGKNLLPGMTFHNPKEGGFVTAACWTPGDAELFIATRQGQAIRFAERQIHAQGTLGLRVDPGDEVAAVTAVTEESSVFLLSHDGKGTVRQMSGFRANKAPGAGGKAALKTDRLVAATAVNGDEDLFLISQLGKLIRFKVEEIPPKEGVVQGVNCMGLRSDSVQTAVATRVTP